MPAMDCGVLDYGDMNWLAVFCAGLPYWLVGAIWYSVLFSKAWRAANWTTRHQIGRAWSEWHRDKINCYTNLQFVCSPCARVLHQV